MKKFGTPIGAGVGKANENVGFCGVGTPPELFSGACPLRTAAGDFGVELITTVLPFTWPERVLPCFGVPVDFGVTVVEVVEVEVVVEDVVIVGVVVEDVGVETDAGVCAHDSDSEMIGKLTGSDSDDNGVPG